MWRKVLTPTLLVILIWLLVSGATTFYLQWLSETQSQTLSENVATIQGVAGLENILLKIHALSRTNAAQAEESPTAQLDRFAGRYSLGDAAIAIARDSDHLMMQLPGQPAVQLLAMSATEFFVRNVDLVISFESDAAGRVTGLTIAQGESRQRLVRRN